MSKLATAFVRKLSNVLFEQYSTLADSTAELREAIDLEVIDRIDNLPKLNEQSLKMSFYEEVLSLVRKTIEEEEAKEGVVPDYDNMTIPEMAVCLKKLKDELDLMSSIKTDVQKAYDFLSINVLPDKMDEAGVVTVRVVDVGRLQASSDIRCNIPASNKGLVEEWLVEHGHKAMIQSAVNASTFKAFVKEQMKTEGETPDSITYPKHLIKVEPYSRATIVKG